MVVRIHKIERSDKCCRTYFWWLEYPRVCPGRRWLFRRERRSYSCHQACDRAIRSFPA